MANIQLNRPQVEGFKGPVREKVKKRTKPDPNNPDSIWGWMSEETRADLDELAKWSTINEINSVSSGGIKQVVRDRKRSGGSKTVLASKL